MKRRSPGIVALALAVVLLASAAACALTKEDVYYGNGRRYARPAEVNARKVFMAIPAYKEIVEKSIEKDSALYIIKLNEANKVFREVIKKFAEDNSYDLVCEEGKVEGAYCATDDVIKMVKEAHDK